MKIGDYVKINENMVVGEAYGGVILNEGMSKYRGKILKVYDTSFGVVWVENCRYLFSNEMVTLLPNHSHFMMISPNSNDKIIDLSIRSKSGKSHNCTTDDIVNSNDVKIPLVYYDYISNINPSLMNYNECIRFIEKLHKITPIKFMCDKA